MSSAELTYQPEWKRVLVFLYIKTKDGICVTLSEEQKGPSNTIVPLRTPQRPYFVEHFADTPLRSRLN